jgi:nucleotide-binding universal stress UspA family protein
VKKLVVATDFSVRSDRALRRATVIARCLGSELTLVHVIDADLPDRLAAAERDAARAILGDIVEMLRTDDGIEARFRVLIDDVYSGILTAADEAEADLVIIGPNRRRWRDIFIGTTAERVVKKAARPVLVAVGQVTGPYRRTLLAVDFGEASKTAARQALAIGVFEQTEVVVMHAFEAPAEPLLKRALEPADAVAEYVAEEREEASAKLRELRAELDLPKTGQCVVASDGSPARTILQTALDTDCDLIVLGTSQPTGLERALIGSVAENVIRDAHRDIMIIPADVP